jgi:hypothetical protein
MKKRIQDGVGKILELIGTIWPTGPKCIGTFKRMCVSIQVPQGPRPLVQLGRPSKGRQAYRR